MELVRFNEISSKIITVRNNKVILDSDVAELYGVETKRVNEAVSNNPDKFPKGYILQLSKPEWYDVRATLLSASDGKSDSSEEPVENFDHLGKRKYSSVLPNAFTEKGLYMLATILKSKKAVETTIDIVETFARLRELSREVAEMVEAPDDAAKQKSVALRAGEIVSDIVTRDLRTTGTETSFEFNLMSAIKVKHTIKRELK